MLQTSIFPVPGTAEDRLLTDEQLMALLGGGESWALAEIHARYARLVFSIALRILNDPASAEEIAQQVFTKIWRYARNYRAERGKFSSWVGTITRHECMDEFRHRRARPIADPTDWESFERLAGDDEPLLDAQDVFEKARVRAALQRIPRQERIVIELAFWGGMSHQEIAVRCGSPLGTVKTRMRLGMRRLRSLLQESV